MTNVELTYKNLIKDKKSLNDFERLSALIHSFILESTSLVSKGITFKYDLSINRSFFEFKKIDFVQFGPFLEIFYKNIQDDIILSVKSSDLKTNLELKLPELNLDFENNPIFEFLRKELLPKIIYSSENYTMTKGYDNLINNDNLNLKNDQFSNKVTSNYPIKPSDFKVENNNNPFFVDNKTGISGNYVGPNSSIFQGGYDSNNNKFTNPQSNIRYDHIGPIGFGGEPIPSIENKILGDNPNLNDLIPKGFLSEKKIEKDRHFP